MQVAHEGALIVAADHGRTWRTRSPMSSCSQQSACPRPSTHCRRRVPGQPHDASTLDMGAQERVRCAPIAITPMPCFFGEGALCAVHNYLWQPASGA